MNSTIFQETAECIEKGCKELFSKDKDILHFGKYLNTVDMIKMWGSKVGNLAFSMFVNISGYKMNMVKIDRFSPTASICSKC